MPCLYNIVTLSSELQIALVLGYWFHILLNCPAPWASLRIKMSKSANHLVSLQSFTISSFKPFICLSLSLSLSLSLIIIILCILSLPVISIYPICTSECPAQRAASFVVKYFDWKPAGRFVMRSFFVLNILQSLRPEKIASGASYFAL